ncbi:MAG: DUF6057 family protein [Tannerella sp.]|jgi:hypothetical protein|nr:DUF6057 family protein [Tannerella sp.]
MKKQRRKINTVKTEYGKSFRHDERSRAALPSFLSFRLIFTLLVFVAFFIYYQLRGRYHFYYIDQENMFVNDAEYFLKLAAMPGGIADYLSCYLIQFFLTPYCGALIISALLTVITWLSDMIARSIAPESNLTVLSLLPAVGLTFIAFDFNYYYSGTIAFCLMLSALLMFLKIKSLAMRLIYASLVSMLLFWIAGPIAFLFAICVFFRELLTRFSYAYGFLLPLALVVGMAFWGVTHLWAGDYRFLLLPDGYYNTRLQPGVVIYYAWIFLIVLMLVSLIMAKWRNVAKGIMIAGITFQIIAVGVAAYFGTQKYINVRAEKFKELDYYVRMEQWNEVKSRCSGQISNYLYKCYLNLALLETGELADEMFAYDQSGIKGLILENNRVTHIAVILSDLYFAAGHNACSQQMAFEANVSTRGTGNPRMYKRLIQTNLVYGAYPVAEKYIALLEKTRNYRQWATDQRRFLWNDQAVEADNLLGMKRKCIVPKNDLADVNGIDYDLMQIAHQNPLHTATMQFLGAAYLLDKDITSIRELIESSYGTDILPTTLPKSLQEAVIILYEGTPENWAKYNVSEAIIKRYNEYKSQVLANRNNTSALPSLLYRSFGDTYWFYFMFKTTE